MRVEGTFEVTSFTPAQLSPPPAEIVTGLPVGVAVLAKTYSGAVEGRSVTIFTAAFDQASGAGTYCAMESFEGALGGAAGSFNFMHSASTSGADRSGEYFVIAPASGTGALQGLTGTGGLATEPGGEHRIWFDYELPAG